MSHPLPLVTITLTTDEIAMASAGLILLRRQWAARTFNLLDAETNEYAGKAVQRISLFIDRLEEAVTPEQGQALMNELIKELRRKPE